MPRADFKTETEKLKSWLCEKSLPFWAETGIDPSGGWYEHLDLDGQPNRGAIRRVRVQARQIYVYALAEKMGWYPGKDIAAKTFDFMLKQGFERDGAPGFIHLITPEYDIENPKRDLYDHAFYLFACGWADHAANHPKALPTAHKIERLLTSMVSGQGGWQESIPNTLPRRQNPHMHMFEASMSWYDHTRDQRWMAQADDIFALFESNFFDSQHNIIREFFNEDWSIASGELGATSEPGHLAEWIWLLWMYQERSGVDTSGYADALYSRLKTYAGPFLIDEEDVDAAPRRETKRLWVQTEVIKAHIAQANRGIQGAAAEAAAVMRAFSDIYLNPNGTWNDQIDKSGVPIAKTIPVSTFYHIICMIYEADCAQITT